MKSQTIPTSLEKSSKFIVFVAVAGIAIAFVNVYKFANHAEPGNAVWAGIALMSFSFLLATQLAKMRSVQTKGGN